MVLAIPVSEINEKGLRVGVVPLEPYARNCIFSSRCPKPGGGTNYDLFRHFATIVGINNLTFVRAEFTKRNHARDPKKWTGILGMLARNEIDASASLLFVEDEKDVAATDFGYPVVSVTRGMVFKLPDIYETDRLSQTVLKPFSPEVWWAILGVCFSVFLFKQLISTFQQQKFSVTRAIFNTFLALEIFCIFRHYKCKFYDTRVSNKRPTFPFDSIEKLVETMEAGKTQYISNSYDGSSLYYVNTSSLPIWKRMAKTFETSPIKVYPSRKEVFHALARNPEFVSIMSEDRFQKYHETFCNVTFIPVSMNIRFLAFAFQKHSWVLPRFNFAMYNKLYSANDMNEQLERRYVSKTRAPCPLPETNARLRPINYVEFGTALLYFTIMYSVGPMACFIFEIVFNFFRMRRLQRMFSNTVGNLASLGMNLMHLSQGKDINESTLGHPQLELGPNIPRHMIRVRSESVLDTHL